MYYTPGFRLDISGHAVKRYRERIAHRFTNGACCSRAVLTIQIREEFFEADRIVVESELEGKWKADPEKVKVSKFMLNTRTQTLFVIQHSHHLTYNLMTVFYFGDLGPDPAKARAWSEMAVVEMAGYLQDWHSHRIPGRKRRYYHERAKRKAEALACLQPILFERMHTEWNLKSNQTLAKRC
jgi:hypothetical protein